MPGLLVPPVPLAKVALLLWTGPEHPIHFGVVHPLSVQREMLQRQWLPVQRQKQLA